MSKSIKYKAGYKYQLAEGYCCWTGIKRKAPITTSYAALSATGYLAVHRGYAWDGPSGPTFDTPNFMRGSLVHDVLYQLIRDGLLPASFRRQADDELRRICIEDGMSRFRAWYVWRAVRWFGAYSSRPQDSRPVITAP